MSKVDILPYAKAHQVFLKLIKGEPVTLKKNKYVLKDGYFCILLDDGTILPTDITVSEFVQMSEDE